MSDLQRREQNRAQLPESEAPDRADHLAEQRGLERDPQREAQGVDAPGPYDWLGGGGSPPPDAPGGSEGGSAPESESGPAQEEDAPAPAQEPAAQTQEPQGGEPAAGSPSHGGGDPGPGPSPEEGAAGGPKRALKESAVTLDASSPGGLLSSLSSQAPSALLSAYGQAQAKGPALLSAQRDSLAATLPERATPTGLPPATGELDGSERPQEATPKAALPAGHGADVQAIVRAPAQAPAARQAPTSIQESADGEVANSAASALGAVGLSTAAVPARFGDRPALQSTGQADPARMSGAQAQAQGEVDSAGAQASRLSLQDFGEHAIAPKQDPERLKARVPIAAPASLEAPAAEAVALPPELQAQVDGAAGPGLRERFAQPLAQRAQSQGDFEQKQASAQAQATTDMAQAETQATQEQRAARAGAVDQVSAARRDWRAQIEAVQVDAGAQAETARSEQQSAIDTKRLAANKEAQAHLDKAEAQAQSKKAQAQRQADAEKSKAEQESGGFWGWVKSKAKALIDGLKATVNAIYDGLRAAVKGLFDLAKKLAEGVIELARKAIVGLIEAYGALLKGILRVALAAFPKLAEAACKRIDQAVAKATQVVNTIAEGLKKGIRAILDFLATTLDKALALVQSLYNAAFTLIGMIISGEWKEILAGLANLLTSAGEAPPQFEAAAYEEVLGGDMSAPLSAAEMQLAGLTPPGAEGGGGGGLGELSGPPWTDNNVGVDQVLSGLELSPELSASLLAQTGGEGQVEFGQSEDPSRSMDSILGLSAGASATQASGPAVVPDDGLSVSERAGAKWTIMKKGLGDWWSKNWPLVLAGGVVGLAGFIAANVLSGGAVMAAIPGILSVLGPLFMGMMAVQVGGYVADYLGKGWAGETKPAGKALAKAVAVGAVELLSYLTFKVGGAAIKGGKAVLAGAKKVGQGALNLAKRGVSYVIKQGKVLLKGLSNTGFGRAFKKVGALGKGLLARTKFKGFRLRVGGGRFVLQGKINPWIDIAGGRTQTLTNTSETIDDLVARLKASEKLSSADIAGAKGVSVEDLLDDIARRAKSGEMGAQGELAAFERKLLENADGVVKGADDIELLREVQRGDDARFSNQGRSSRGNPGGKVRERKTPDYRTRGEFPELVDIKTAVEPPKDWKKWINNQIKSVNKQIKFSRLSKGKPGGADLQVFGNAADSLRAMDPAELERFVFAATNGQNSAVSKVRIIIDGEVAFSFERVGDALQRVP